MTWFPVGRESLAQSGDYGTALPEYGPTDKEHREIDSHTENSYKQYKQWIINISNE